MPKRINPNTAGAAIRAAGLIPTEPYPGAKRPWHCTCGGCGAELKPRLQWITRDGYRCPYCSGRRNTPEQRTEVMRRAGYEPLEPYPGSSTPWRCRCTECGKESQPHFNNVDTRGTRCVHCGRERMALTRRNDADEAAATMRAAGLEPLKPYPGSHEPWRCRCTTCGREVTPSYNSVSSRGTGCIQCGYAASGLARRTPEAEAIEVVRAKGLEPLAPYPGALKRWHCRCVTCGTDVYPKYNNITYWGGCKYCAAAGRADNTRRPEDDAVAIMRDAGVEPKEPYKGRKHRWRGECLTCHRTVTPTLDSALAGQNPCKYCAHRAVDPAAAAALMQSMGLEPQCPYPGAGDPWPSRCAQCGNVVSPKYNNVRTGHGCSHCATGGFDVSAKEAIVYLIKNTALNAAKIGVCSISEDRLRTHRKYGWEVVTTVRVPGPRALEIEAFVLKWWRVDLHLDPYLGPDEMPRRGWTETVDLMEIDQALTIARMRMLADPLAGAAQISERTGEPHQLSSECDPTDDAVPGLAKAVSPRPRTTENSGKRL